MINSGERMENARDQANKIFEYFEGQCMIVAVQSAEKYFLGSVITADVVEFYEYPKKVENTDIVPESRFRLQLFYLIAILAKSGIATKQQSYQYNLWKQDDYSRCMKNGMVVEPIPQIGFNSYTAVTNIPDKLDFPVFVASYNERTNEGHAWFVPDEDTFTRDAIKHLVQTNAYADNYYASELRLETNT